jgi:hypothetical protein
LAVRQRLQIGFASSHFTRRLRQVAQPVRVRLSAAMTQLFTIQWHSLSLGNQVEGRKRYMRYGEIGFFFEVQAAAYQDTDLTGGITIAVPLLMEVNAPCMGVSRVDHVFEDLLPTSCVMGVGS